MRRRSEWAALILVVASALAPAGCARREPAPLAVGSHRVRLRAPAGWEHLDHGRQQLFRRGEWQIALVDLGPAAREGEALGADSATIVLTRVLADYADMERNQVARQSAQLVLGTAWVKVEIHDRVTHLNPRRIALTDDRSALMALRIDRGPLESTGEVFERLLASIEVLP